MRKDIIQSKTEPNKSDIWLSEEGLKKYGKDGWELLGGGVSPNTPTANDITGEELIPINQNGNNKAVSVEQIINKVLEIPSKFEFVDLGLPSGTKWATCNIGANSPEEPGLYFAWGETEGYTAEDITNGVKQFSTDEYTFYDDSYKLTKYNNNSDNGIVDNLTTLELVDDAAYITDNTCRMPTNEELEELIANTTNKWETLNGINGRRFTSNVNNNSIFIPVSGYAADDTIVRKEERCYLWTSIIDETSTRYSHCLYFSNSSAYISRQNRYYGCAVRPVQAPNTPPTTINLKELKDKVDNVEPYVWDGLTISETIFNELVKAVQSNREIILITGALNEGGGGFGFRMISATLIGGHLYLTFCYTYSSPNYVFEEYVITSNSVKLRELPLYAKDRRDGTNLNTAYYTNVGLISNDTTLTFSKTAYASEYEGQFNFGDTVYNITFPSGVKWSTDSILDYKPNHTYQFRIVNGFGVMKEFAEILTMTIDGNSYNFEKGFTWGDWVNSKYNRGKYYINEYDVIVRQSDGYYLSLNNSNVHAPDYIIEKALYNTYYSDSNDDL